MALDVTNELHLTSAPATTRMEDKDLTQILTENERSALMSLICTSMSLDACQALKVTQQAS